MTPHLTCIIATTPRAGSWMLSDALLSTGQIGPPEEFFRPEVAWLYRQEWGLPEDAPITDHIAKAIESGTSSNGVFGVKMHWYQWAWLTRSLREACHPGDTRDDVALVSDYLPDPHFVFLRRGDLARQAISHYRAVESGIWNVRVDERVPPRARLARHEPDYGRIRWHEDVLTNQTDRWIEFFDSATVPSFEVVYEDAADDLGPAVVDILRFLGLAVPAGAGALQSNLRPQSDDRTERWLEEYLLVRDDVVPNPRPPEDYLRYGPTRPA